MQYNVLDLFCGCGGMSKGLEDAGLNVIAGIDIWNQAINSYKKNFNHQGICEDLTKLSPEQFQQKYNQDNKQIDIIVGGPPCFIAGTFVQTITGFKKIEDVLLNDKLLSHTGKFQRILNLQQKIYSGNIYEIDIKNHPNNIYCTEDHPFYVRNKSIKQSFNEPEWKKAKDLTKNDYFGMVINTNNIIPEFTLEQDINQYKTIKLDKHEYWYMIGYFVGNGWIVPTKKRKNSIQNNIKFMIENTDEVEIVEKIRKILPIVDQYDSNGKYKKFGCSNQNWFTPLEFLNGHKYP